MLTSNQTWWPEEAPARQNHRTILEEVDLLLPIRLHPLVRNLTFLYVGWMAAAIGFRALGLSRMAALELGLSVMALITIQIIRNARNWEPH